jgi:hypothetical protein
MAIPYDFKNFLNAGSGACAILVESAMVFLKASNHSESLFEA